MKKFKVGDLVVSTETRLNLKQGTVYTVTAQLLENAYEISADGRSIIYGIDSYLEHATKLHKLLAGDENV
jgi:hypothetical protein